MTPDNETPCQLCHDPIDQDDETERAYGVCGDCLDNASWDPENTLEQLLEDDQ